MYMITHHTNLHNPIIAQTPSNAFYTLDKAAS